MADGLCSSCKAARQCEHDRGPWITTHSRNRFYVLDPKPEEIHIEDIAHHLARINRFVGAFSWDSYSVAQHSVLVADVVREMFEPIYYAGEINPEQWRTVRLQGLLHDASEAYYNDLPRPVKLEVGGRYGALERSCDRAVFARFGLGDYKIAQVKDADNEVLSAEASQIFDPPLPWAKPYRASIKIQPWAPQLAEEIFLQRFEMFGGKQ